MLVRDFNTPLLPGSPPKNHQRNLSIKWHYNIKWHQIDLTDIYKEFHPAAAQYTFFSAANRTFLKIDHILGHKVSLNKYKKVEITPCILQDCNAIKLELNSKHSNTWRLSNTLLNDQWVIKVGGGRVLKVPKI
jgi:hypothetical protein